MTDVQTPIKLRKQILEWAKEIVGGRDIVDGPEAANELADRIGAAIQRDPEFLASYLEQEVRPRAYETIRSVFKRVRPGAIEYADGMMESQEHFEAEASGDSPFEEWWVHASGKYHRFKRMDGFTLDAAISEGHQRVKYDLIPIRMWELARGGLEAPDQTVEERYSDIELAGLLDKARTQIDKEYTC